MVWAETGEAMDLEASVAMPVGVAVKLGQVYERTLELR